MALRSIFKFKITWVQIGDGKCQHCLLGRRRCCRHPLPQPPRPQVPPQHLPDPDLLNVKEKTKLLTFAPRGDSSLAYWQETALWLAIDGETVDACVDFSAAEICRGVVKPVDCCNKGNLQRRQPSGVVAQLVASQAGNSKVPGSSPATRKVLKSLT